MRKKQTSNTPKPTPKAPTNRGIKATIGYTLRTVPRADWNPFRSRLDKQGRTVNWAFNQFVKQYGQHDERIVLADD